MRLLLEFSGMDKIRLSALGLAILLLGGAGLGAAGPAAPAVGVPGSPIPEVPDFATLVLHDPWDMQQYSDISQYLNGSGQQNLVASPAVANGEFTGQSVGDVTGNDASFFTLFPGYDGTVVMGKAGQRYPISSAAYHCLYLAVQVNSPAPGGFGPDQFRVFWFADAKLTGGTWGVTQGIPLYPDTAPTNHSYRLYAVDLASVGHSGAAWTDSPTWQGLRIDPTLYAGVSFAVDWVRLAPCGQNLQTITWTPDASISAAWIQPSGTSRWIRLASNLDGTAGTAQIDFAGVQPGSYLVGLGDSLDPANISQQSTSPLVIDPAPVADFVSPSFFSGPDYASQAGTPWDFNSPADVAASHNMTYTLHDGLLDTTTPSGPPPGGVNAQFFPAAPQPVPPSHFRYLSFHIETDWKAPWQNVPQGMIVRWLWGIQDQSGQPGHLCWLVGHDAPIDIGWQTYWMDLGDSFSGAPLASAGNCPGSLPSWTSGPTVFSLRFDPNENITVGHDSLTGGGPFHQLIDWMRLTAVDSVASGTPYLIQLHLNRDVDRIAYFYTTDRADPTQAAARQFIPAPPAGPFALFLPLLMNAPLTPPGSVNMDQGGLPIANTTFAWDTTGVAANTYYICTQVTGGGNTEKYCSETPVIVSPANGR